MEKGRASTAGGAAFESAAKAGEPAQESIALGMRFRTVAFAQPQVEPEFRLERMRGERRNADARPLQAGRGDFDQNAGERAMRSPGVG